MKVLKINPRVLILVGIIAISITFLVAIVGTSSEAVNQMLEEPADAVLAATQPETESEQKQDTLTEALPVVPAAYTVSTEYVTTSELFTWEPDPVEVEALAKALYGECRGVKSTMEQAAVVWCILNRVDSRYYPNSVLEVLAQPYQFQGYKTDHPVTPYLEALAADVLVRWHMEKEGEVDVGRVLPQTYIYFMGDGVRNYFTEEFRSCDYWNWALSDPYQ